MNVILEKARTYAFTTKPETVRKPVSHRKADWTELHRLRRELDDLLTELRLEVIRLRSRP